MTLHKDDGVVNPLEYDILAPFYDELVGADYLKLYQTYCDIWAHFGLDPKTVLDLGCGTGSLLPYLEQSRKVVGIDISSEMLSLAQSKAREDTLLLCQDMRTFTLFSRVDAVVCALDGINALPNEKAVADTFASVISALSQDGLFIFDINTPYKYFSILDGQSFVYDTERVYCVWRSAADREQRRCDFFLDLFIPNGRGLYERKCEHIVQRIYDIDAVCGLLRDSGFELLAVYGEQTFDAPASTEERVFFVCRKGK